MEQKPDHSSENEEKADKTSPPADGIENKVMETFSKIEAMADYPRRRAMKRKREAAANPYATFNERVFASVLDVSLSFLVLGPVMLGLSKLIYGNSRGNPLSELQQYGSVDQVAAHLYAQGYFHNLALDYGIHFVVFGVLILWLWGASSATPGKWALRQRIVDAETFCQPTTKQFIVRYVGYVISMLPLTLGFLWIIVDKKNRAWHDIMSGTVVVKVKHWQFRDDGITPHIILPASVRDDEDDDA